MPRQMSLLLIAQNDILLPVQADNGLQKLESISAQAQLIAEAVAAFNENNGELMRLPPLVSRVSHFSSWLIGRPKLVPTSPRPCLAS